MKVVLKRPVVGPLIFVLLVASLGLVACGDNTATSAPAVVPTTAAVATTAAAGAAAPGGAGGLPPVNGTPVKTATGLQYIDVVVGSGAEAKNGTSVSVHYTGYLTNGTKFDSSLDRGQPFPLALPGQVIQGWNEGIPGMKVGGKRRLLIPAALGYGSRGAGGVIPPNADLVFDVELLAVK